MNPVLQIQRIQTQICVRKENTVSDSSEIQYRAVHTDGQRNSAQRLDPGSQSWFKHHTPVPSRSLVWTAAVSRRCFAGTYQGTWYPLRKFLTGWSICIILLTKFLFFTTADSHLNVIHHRIRFVLLPDDTRRALLLRLQQPVQFPDIISFHHPWDIVARAFKTQYDTHRNNMSKSPFPDGFSATHLWIDELHFNNVKTRSTCLCFRLQMTGDLAGRQWRISLRCILLKVEVQL